jgi:hypothetical protein
MLPLHQENCMDLYDLIHILLAKVFSIPSVTLHFGTAGLLRQWKQAKLDTSATTVKCTNNVVSFTGFRITLLK